MLLIPHQLILQKPLPIVNGPIEYHEQRDYFENMDRILSTSGLEQEFIIFALKEKKINPKTLKSNQLARFCRTAILALRHNIAFANFRLSHVEFCARLGDSPILQRFLGLQELDRAKTYGKSASSRFTLWVNDETVKLFNEKFVNLMTHNNIETGKPNFSLPAIVSCDDVFFDGTCLKVNIHFPIDWLLLKDAVRSLANSTQTIRNYDLKNRIPQPPFDFLSDMNTLVIEMTAAARKKHKKADAKEDGKKCDKSKEALSPKMHMKKILRKMFRLVKRTARHAIAHLKLLKKHYAEVNLTDAQAQVTIKNIENITKQIDHIIAQARKRIISEEKVENKDKTLSLYDEDVNIIIRGKANARVEVGNYLWLGEVKSGIIIDYQLHKEVPVESSLLKPALVRLVDVQKVAVKTCFSDRSIQTKSNSKMLEEKGIKDGLCPRDPKELARRIKTEPDLREGLKRRASTEGRISIMNNKFLANTFRAKGFKHRALSLGWGVFAHNLWKVTHLAQATALEAEAKSAA
jgi:hypothetical protein